MDFTGTLNFPNPKALAEADAAQREAFLASRWNCRTTIVDARARFGTWDASQDASAPLLDGPGFVLTRSPSAVAEWSDTADVAAHYYPETRALLQSLLPEADVWPIESHTYRDESITEHFWKDGVQYGPSVEAVHNDYADFMDATGRVVERRFSDVMGMPQDRRVVGFNIWRSVSEAPLERLPLAVCDRTSIDPRDLEYDLNENAGPVAFNAHFCRPNPGQRWYWFPHMNRDEALVFLTYDSHPEGVFRPTLHTAVKLPGSDGAQPRESIEVRHFAALPLP